MEKPRSAPKHSYRDMGVDVHEDATVDLRKAVFRANPAYELVLLDRLTDGQRAMLTRSRRDDCLYGVLRSRGSTGQDIRAVGHDTALLFFTLQQPGRLPAYVEQRFSGAYADAVGELVMDEVLEIEHGGKFVSGAGAQHVIGLKPPATRTDSVTARLSHDALRYAQSLQIEDAIALSMRLYLYNRVPLSERWRQRFADPGTVQNVLGIDSGNRAALSLGWARESTGAASNAWLSWVSLRQRRELSDTGVHKLYISPRIDRLADVFAVSLSVFSATPTLSFKVGASLPNLLRPDKLIAYFDSLDALAETAHRLEQRLSGCPVHGVPFTAAVTTDGLLSWGIDPSLGSPVPVIPAPTSWRLWVTSRLAAALLVARRSPQARVEPWQYAVARLRASGVDPSTWAPAHVDFPTAS